MLELLESGLYCEKAGVYIDPWLPVDKAIITHAHADHSRAGSKHYLAHPYSEGVMRHRLGKDISFQGLDYNQKIRVNGVDISLHPAGHIPGSAQIRLVYKGQVWVVSGDYKLDNDGISTPFEAIKCDTFITECTFGLPAFQWPDQRLVFQDINDWWSINQSKGLCSVIYAYSLGKAQRILENLEKEIGSIYVHGAIANTNEALKESGVRLSEYLQVNPSLPKKKFQGAIIVAPPAAINSSWTNKFTPYRSAIASGWVNIRGQRKRKAVDRGFILSDHADWTGLNNAVNETGAEQVITTHGYTAVFSKWLNERGIKSSELKTQFEGETLDRVDNEDVNLA